MLVVPGFAFGGLAGAQIQLMLMAAVTMALTFVLADRLTGRRLISWVLTLCLGLTATAFIYSSEIYPEFPAALALVLSLLLVTRRYTPGIADALLMAVLLTAMCWLGIKYAPLAALISGYFLIRGRRSGTVALLTAGTALRGLTPGFTCTCSEG